MRLTSPRQITFWVAVALAVIGLLAALVQIPVLTGLAVWIVIVGFIVLAAGNTVTGLWITRYLPAVKRSHFWPREMRPFTFFYPLLGVGVIC